ncbi:hypothetical protein APR04_004104 [Promicromonospora umidemergens]|uniref:Uncharacterized protein n=1 Tax=Promicromonospora umidemergens TaxID=629679 RepID=A0ABP8XSY0_9MICO|nr:hypothetical protein [Promicromonospora umidemergens]
MNPAWAAWTPDDDRAARIADDLRHSPGHIGTPVFGVVENNPKAATWIESRMEALGVRGYVRITS